MCKVNPFPGFLWRSDGSTRVTGSKYRKWDDKERQFDVHAPSVRHGGIVKKRRALGLEIGWFIHTRLPFIIFVSKT